MADKRLANLNDEKCEAKRYHENITWVTLTVGRRHSAERDSKNDTQLVESTVYNLYIKSVL